MLLHQQENTLWGKNESNGQLHLPMVRLNSDEQ